MVMIRYPDESKSMTRLKSILYRMRWWLAIIATPIMLVAFRPADDNLFEISRNLDVFTTLFRELMIYYVDPTEPQELVTTGIDAMLESLDPYTQFIPESEADDYRFMTTGQYGGIGALIGQREGDVIITDPYEGYPAQKAGLMSGDIIKAIDGKSVKGKEYDDVSKMLKGQPNTSISITVLRPGTTQEITRTLQREEIQIKNVPYYGLLDNAVGYIRLSGFTDDAGREVKDAVQDLKKKGAKGIILDVRSNPGGLLNEAVNVVNVFVDRGQEVVSTRGKMKEWDKTYKALNAAIDTKIPLAVLVNPNAASASEIVSGALQDLDRAIVIGQRTFGKGLVQTTRPLSYNAQLKITTAKYYIPSGRCIQALDYAHRKADGSVDKVADSLVNEFKTSQGRKVYDGGGISPDYITEIPVYSSISQSLASHYLLFDYATEFRIKNPSIAPAKTFRLSDEDYNRFVAWLDGKEYDYVTDSEKKLEDFKAKAEKEKYFAMISKDYETLAASLRHDKKSDLQLHKAEIKELLENEIVSRYYYQNGRIENSFDSDVEVKLALKALNNPSVYSAIFNRTYKD
jgi:carboxyl-terminal processing protease